MAPGPANMKNETRTPDKQLHMHCKCGMRHQILIHICWLNCSSPTLDVFPQFAGNRRDII